MTFTKPLFKYSHQCARRKEASEKAYWMWNMQITGPFKNVHVALCSTLADWINTHHRYIRQQAFRSAAWWLEVIVSQANMDAGAAHVLSKTARVHWLLKHTHPIGQRDCPSTGQRPWQRIWWHKVWRQPIAQTWGYVSRNKTLSSCDAHVTASPTKKDNKQVYESGLAQIATPDAVEEPTKEAKSSPFWSCLSRLWILVNMWQTSLCTGKKLSSG